LFLISSLVHQLVNKKRYLNLLLTEYWYYVPFKDPLLPKLHKE